MQLRDENNFVAGWDQIAKWLIESKGRQKWVRITRESAARGQIESAILLWFLDADVASIHTLTIAAQELLHSVGKKRGKPCRDVTWIKSLPKADQKLMRLPQNFFKHANTDPNAQIDYPPTFGDMHLIDDVISYQELYDKLTPIMRLFATRFAVEYLHILPVDETAKQVLMGIQIDDLAELSRSEFLVKCLPRFRKKRNGT
jgi:hypothetical protein